MAFSNLFYHFLLILLHSGCLWWLAHWDGTKLFMSGFPKCFCNPIFLHVQTCPNLSKLVQACPGLFRLVQICPDMSKIVQACPDLFRLVQACPNLSRKTLKIVWIISSVIKNTIKLATVCLLVWARPDNFNEVKPFFLTHLYYTIWPRLRHNTARHSFLI